MNETLEKPFHLKAEKTKATINIVNHQNSERLKDGLETTHYKYDRTHETFIEAAATFATSNEITTGVEMTEKMLKNGTILLAFGRLEKLQDNSFVISRPFNSDCPFIITKENRLSLIDSLRSELSLLKVGLVVVSTIGFATAVFCFVRLYLKLNNKSEKREDKKEKTE